MNTEQKIEGNKLIAEFMGCKIGENKYQIDTLPFHGETDKTGLWYHTSWDWLMPVVEKIEAIRDKDYGWFGIYIHSNACDIQGQHAFKSDAKGYISDPNAIFETKIESTWYNVVEFIKWYNTQKQNQ